MAWDDVGMMLEWPGMMLDDVGSGGSRGGARGAGAPPLAREKNFFIYIPGLAPWPPQLAISCVA